jgi:hypothetical protein
MGALYADHQPINIIEQMTFSDLQYWNSWHDALQKAWSDAAKNIKGKVKK